MVWNIWCCGKNREVLILQLCSFSILFWLLRPLHFHMNCKTILVHIISVLYCMKQRSIFAWNVFFVYLIFLKRSLFFPIKLFSSIALLDHWGRHSYLSFLVFGTLHSDSYTFSFHLFFSLLFFSQIFVRPLQTTILPFCISLFRGWSWSLSPVQCQEPLSIVHQTVYQI